MTCTPSISSLARSTADRRRFFGPSLRAVGIAPAGETATLAAPWPAPPRDVANAILAAVTPPAA